MTRTSVELIAHVNKAIHDAHENISKVDEDTFDVGGFCTPLMRRLYNNLCNLPDVGYLEVGAFKGASLCAAACGNTNGVFYSIESFAQDFGSNGVRDELLRNIEAARAKGSTIRLIEEDFWNLSEASKAELGLVRADVLMYDGEHSEKSQRKAMTALLPYMADACILIVDDASWDTVRDGTLKGLQDISKQRRVVREHIYHVGQNDHPLYHNGVALYVLEKV